jgi:hypothetical protein
MRDPMHTIECEALYTHARIQVSAVRNLLARVRSSGAFVHDTYDCVVQGHKIVYTRKGLCTLSRTVSLVRVLLVFLMRMCVQPCGRLHTR